MRIAVDLEENSLTVEQDGRSSRKLLFSDEGFEALSELWLKVGWNQRYSYTFSWFGRPIIQLPEDLLRVQEVIYRVKPDVVVETGVAHGGSLVFYASLCKVMQRGRVVGVDVEIRPQNRDAIESHELGGYISLIEGDSTSLQVIQAVRKSIKPGERVLVILDSNHSYAHVLGELEAYSPLVGEGSYVIVTDGVMKDLTDVPQGRASWDRDNPCQAVADFVARHPEFVVEQPAWVFNQSSLRKSITYWPNGYLRRTRSDGGAVATGGS
jgi:cephalosporin hydroxylase